MKQNKKFILIGLLTLLVFTLVPSTTLALDTESFDQEVTDYFFLEFVTVGNSTSGVTNFTIPAVNTNWMIEVTSLTEAPPTDNLSGKVYEDTGSYLDKWQPTALFGPSEIDFGQYSNVTGYTIDPTFESLFPVPFIIPTNHTAVNQTLNASLSSKFQYVMYQNISGYIPPDFAGLFSLHSMVFAFNGTMDMNGTVLGNTTGDILLEAVYFGDGELNFLRESWWDNSTQEWNTMYKLVSPLWGLIGSMFEPNLPGSPSSGGGGGMIPGFEWGIIFLGLLVSVVVIYLRKPKEEIII